MTTTSARRAAAVLGYLLIVPLAGAGCGLLTEHLCGGGHYPAAQIDGPGRYCEETGKEPDPRFVRYPDGKVPVTVGDPWDAYWDKHYLDRDGHEYPAPATTG